ncbi:HTH-type transcriptional regulator Ptr1 [uncultured archaeon]|nr:HTH-type transcriptional regulator Ptr1 [uncultured archaeon]
MVDKIDREILSLLDLDSNQSYNSLGKKISRSKQFVAYRINNLIREGVIRGFYTDLNLRKMGYSLFNILLQLHKADKNGEEKLLDYLKKSKQVGFCFRTLGNWDFFISVKTEGIKEFYNFLGEFHNLFGRFLKKESINFETNSISTNLRFLSIGGNKVRNRISVNSLIDEKRKFSDFEKRLILKLRERPSIKLFDLALELNKSPQVTNRIMKNLMDEEILIRNRVSISTEKLGFERYLFLIELHYLNKQQKERLFASLQDQNNITYTMECVGSWNLVCNVYSKNITELTSMIEKLKYECPAISSIEFLRVIESKKETFNL